MFNSKRANRSESRAAALLLEWKTLRDRVNSAEAEVQVALEEAVTDLYDRLVAENGAILPMSEKEKAKQAEKFRRLAQGCGSSNAAKSLAFSIIAMHLQALCMRGSDADVTAAGTADFIFNAFEAKNAV